MTFIWKIMIIFADENMVIQNPYPPIPHKAFKRTFLQEVSASITFAETSLLHNKTLLERFLKSNFGITGDIPEFATLGGVNISSEDGSEKYEFTTTSAKVSLNANVYRFYKETLEPKIKRILEFAEAIGIDKVNTLSISKSNIFRGTSENAFSAWRFALHESFKDERLQDLASNAAVQDQPFKITVEGIGKFDGGEVRVPFQVEVIDKSNFQFQMNIIGVATDVEIMDFVDNAEVLNEIIYCSFCNMVSDKVINLLQQE